MLATASLAKFGTRQAARRDISRGLVLVAWMLLDGAILAGAGLLTLWFQKQTVAASPAGPVSHCAAVLLTSVAVVGIYKHTGAYHLVCRPPKDDAKRTIATWVLIAAGLTAVAIALGLDRHFSGPWAGLWVSVTAVGLAIERCLVVRCLIRLNEKKLVRHRVMVIPADRNALLVEQRLKESGELGLEVTGFVDDRPGEAMATCVPPERIIGDTRNLLQIIRDNEVEEVVIVMPWTAAARIERLLMLLTETAVRVSLVTGPPTSSIQRRVAALGGISVVRLSDRPIAGLARVIKTLEDTILAPLILLLAVPLLSVIAVAVKLDSPGPVLFCQSRVGFNGRPFTALKFRTMYVAATDVAGKRQAIRNDPRVTRVGAWLRKTSFDELPQLVNVLRGEMSLVGPRPHAPGTTVEGRLFHEAVSRYAARHRVMPGITGWAQVNGWRGETDRAVKLEERLRHDLYYIEHWTLSLDIIILARTLLVPFRHCNAY